ncbi:MAG: hypothetical protein LBP28_05695 [Coriobacteriales bacterium]|jgi:hypothetical protein|nr:hypothetical protein [Coriobacteriales bacterium]
MNKTVLIPAAALLLALAGCHAPVSVPTAFDEDSTRRGIITQDIIEQRRLHDARSELSEDYGAPAVEWPPEPATLSDTQKIAPEPEPAAPTPVAPGAVASDPPAAANTVTAADIRWRESGNNYQCVTVNEYGTFVGAYMFAEQYQQARYNYMGWGTYDRAEFLASPAMQDAEAQWYVNNYFGGDWARFR